MKKVLALVLAVIMVCTMAMAAPVYVDTTNKLEITGDTTLAKITLDSSKRDTTDFSKVYYLKVPTDYFALLGNAVNMVPVGKTYADVFTVTGLNGGFNANNGDEYYIPVKIADKAQDDVADLSLDAFTIKKNADNYVSFKVVNNAFVVDKLVIGSEDKTSTATNPTNVLYAKYDIGYAATPLFYQDGSKVAPSADGWYYNNSSKATTVNLDTGVTLTVPAKTYFTFKSITAGTPDASYGLTPKVTKGYAVSAGTIEYKIEATQGSNDLYYAVNKDGKEVYTAGLTFVKEKNALGVESSYWTLKTTDYLYGISIGTKALNVSNIPGATTGTTETTTNPGTGANDVVGVAAALAVVALVSGAAISLKK